MTIVSIIKSLINHPLLFSLFVIIKLIITKQNFKKINYYWVNEAPRCKTLCAVRMCLKSVARMHNLLTNGMTRIFNSVAMEDVYNCSIIQQCRMLEAHLGTSVLAMCLNDPSNAVQTVLRQKEKILQKDFSNLLLSAKGSAQLAASIASKVSWRHLWDIALEKGVKGTKIVRSLF